MDISKLEYKVSVRLMTFMHANFIKDAMDGIMMQKTNFMVEVVVGDDFSTDGTIDIIKEYVNTNNVHIKILDRKINDEYWQKRQRHGRLYNFINILENCSGKYTALLDGDDYWIDPLKLQKQVDFLEANSDYSLCFHDALILWEDKIRAPKYFCSNDQKQTSTIEDVIEKWFMPSASMVIRKDYITPLPEWFKDIYNGDWALQMLLADKGKIRYIDKVMSVYRKNQGALSSGIGKDVEFINNQKINVLNYFNTDSNGSYKSHIYNKITLLKQAIKKNHLRKKFPVLYFFRYPSKLVCFFIRKVNLC